MSPPAPVLLAQSHRLAESRHDRSVRTEVERLSRRFKAVFRELTTTAPVRAPIRGAEWLLDNDYVVQRAVRVIRKSLPAHYLRQLPVVADSHRLRVREVCEFALRSGGSPVDVDWLAEALQQYQSVAPLTLGEVWALPAMLRLAVLDRLLESAEGLREATESNRALDRRRTTEIASLIVSLRTLAATDWFAFVERVSLVEALLREDPSGHYPLMEKDSRNHYRQQVEAVARWARLSEIEVAQRALALAGGHADGDRRRHVGYYLIDRGRSELERRSNVRVPLRPRVGRWLERRAALLYPLAITLLALGLLVPVGDALLAAGASLWLVLLAALPGLVISASVSTALVNWLITQLVPPRPVPKLDFEKSVTRDCRAAVAMPVILGRPDDLEPLLARLEMNYLGNAEPSLHFVLLTDLADADAEELATDAAIIDAIGAGIADLRKRHPDGHFFWLHRPRRWNPVAGRWMGWERKRGKLTEFNHFLLSGDASAFSTGLGELEQLADLRYVITLDADTQLPTGSAQRLLGTFAHPLNQGRFDPESQQMSAGYTVIQPRLETSPESANRSVFARAYAGEALLDLYSTLVSDVYHDVIGSAIFAGKAVYDVAALERSLENRVPDDSILSHDLFEGLHGRVALASDVNVFEDFPPSIPAFMRRLHRWVRGDWQLLPWLLPRVPCADGERRATRFKLIDRWKIGDNLRRSLEAPSLLLLLLLGWLALPVPAWLWTIGWLAALAMPLWLCLAGGLVRVIDPDAPTQRAMASAGWTAGHQMRRWLLAIALLPYEAVTTADAIVRTLWRLRWGRARLLEWMPSMFADRKLGATPSMRVVLGEMRVPLLLTVAAFVAVVLGAERSVLWVALPLLAGWLAAPVLVRGLSRVTPSLESQQLDAAGIDVLRVLARRTWSFFEAFTGPDRHWLPPDNYHEEPREFVAERTSPTNIGLMLTSTVAAHDLGYLTTQGLGARLAHSLDTIERLRRHRGHLLNWYHTRTLEPLEPRYISTVDSGNLAGALLVVAEGLREAARAPIICPRLREGFEDAIAVLREHLLHHDGGSPDAAIAACERLGAALPEPVSPGAWRQALDHAFASVLPALIEHVTTTVEQPGADYSAQQVAVLRADLGRLSHQLQSMLLDCDHLLPWLAHAADPPPGLGRTTAAWLESLTMPPCLAELPSWSRRRRQELGRLRTEETAHADWFDTIDRSLLDAESHALGLLGDLRELSQRCLRLVDDTDFGFLYDPDRHLFYIGYNVSAAEYDPNHYDLLASEARLASYIAIAKRQAPLKHWLQLGRPFTRLGGRRVLVSWSATAFEYLMPGLFMASPERGVLDQSCRAAVARQARYGRRHGIPWGISESGFYELDEQSHYQYRAFGVPGLGLKREAEFRLVVSPYASLLALRYAAHDVVDNLAALRERAGIGCYGAFEAIDFGSPRERKGRRGRVVRSYMSHHQGMILMAIDNAIHGDPMVARFHRDPDIQRVDYLLYERLPPGLPSKLGYRSAGHPELGIAPSAGLESWVPRAAREINVLSNGTLHSILASDGAMHLSWRGLALTRGALMAEPSAPSRRLYLYDPERRVGWSPAATAEGSEARVLFAPNEVQFHNREHGLRSRLDIVVAQEHDVEIQRLTLTNTGTEKRRVRALHYAEPVLSAAAEDSRHPGFSKLFVETTAVGSDTLLFRRRPRGGHERPLYLAQTLVGADPEAILSCTDRAQFLGRGGNYREPAGVAGCAPRALAGAPALDPVAVLGAEVELAGRQSVELIWLTGVHRERKGLLAALERYRQRQRVDWASWQARYASERELNDLRLGPRWVPQVMALVSRLLALPAAGAGQLGSARTIQRSLWSHGISGDRPILLVHLRDAGDLELAKLAVLAAHYCQGRGLDADLVILDYVSTGYAQPVRDRLRRLAKQAESRGPGRSGRIILLGASELRGDEWRGVAAAARVILDSAAGSFEDQLAPSSPPLPPPPFVPLPSTAASAITETPLPRPTDLKLDNGLGGFSPDGSEYVIYLGADELPPQPWINVLANPGFGSLVSASGAMFTWAGNSGENRLTPWFNDPVRDPTGEALFLRDEETAEVWSPTPRPAPSGHPYEVRHGAGYTRFIHHAHGIRQTLSVHVDPERPLKFLTLTLTNQLERPRRLTATCYVEWVLGSERDLSAPFLVSDFADEHAALLARNAFRQDRSEATSFLAASRPAHCMTTDRDEFLGPARDLSSPAGLKRIGLAGRIAAGIDSCAALQVHVDLAAGAEQTLHFVLGEAADRDAALALAAQAREQEAAAASLADAIQHWRGLLDGCRIETPDPAFDLLFNRCLLYQAQACRLWARAALYQCGGGLGFRDQLQDILALTAHQPELARAQILEAARSQFVEGDVLHWWHPEPRRGVRTRCSDDLVWLPYVTAHYVAVTGDREILNVEVPFLRAPELRDGELERYAEFAPTEFGASLYEHCWRALDRALAQRGPNGLPLIGTGDWNDGFSRVGVNGQGESVWLGWFLIAVCERFAPFCDDFDDAARADNYRRNIAALKQAIEANAWDGEWYRRAYYDDGSPLGAADNLECRIDLNAQSWAVMSGAAESGRQRQAMDAALRELVVPEHRLILLLTPPFDRTRHDPGYIKGYPRGVRENGGQYTHAAIWAAWALAELGRAGEANRLFEYLNPLKRCIDIEAVEHYRVEPYVMAADVYGAEPYTGRGGWSWYTGAAGWMYRLGVERILGLRKRGDELEIAPCLPAHWPGYRVCWRHGGSRYLIEVRLRPTAATVLECDGQRIEGRHIPLRDDGREHLVTVTLPGNAQPLCKDREGVTDITH